MECKKCISLDTIFENGLLICRNCGFVNCDIIDYDDYTPDRVFYKKVYYQRLNYFIKVLNLVCCVNLTIDNNFIDIVNFCKKKYKPIKDDFENLINLKFFIKKHKYKQYLKYIYILYFKLYGKKLIQLNHDQYYTIIEDFKILNDRFEKTIQKRNIFNYQFLLFKLFLKNNIDCYNYIILPRTTPQLEINYNKLIKL